MLYSVLYYTAPLVYNHTGRGVGFRVGLGVGFRVGQGVGFRVLAEILI